MAYIGRDPQYGAFEKQSLTGDGSTVTFNLDYTVGSAITFTAAPGASDTVFIIFLGVALEVATIGTGAITSRTELVTAANDDLLLIYDTDAGSLKKIQKSNLSPTINLTYNTRTGTGDGSTVAFTVTDGVTVDDVLVTENGVLQAPTTDYTISGTTLTFGTAPASGVAIVIRELP
jgi:hypothetical protein